SLEGFTNLLGLRRRARFRVVAVPLGRSAQPLGQIDLGLPVGEPAELGRVDVLAIDLARGVPGPPDIRLDTAARELGDQRDDLAHRVGTPAAAVERFAANLVSVET